MSTIDAWYLSLPPFTRGYLTISCIASILVTLQLTQAYYYMLSFSLIYSNFEI